MLVHLLAVRKVVGEANVKRHGIFNLFNVLLRQRESKCLDVLLEVINRAAATMGKT